MDRRASPRKKRRFLCELEADGRVHPGVAMNLSREGLFVLTSFSPVQGEQIRLHIQEIDGLDRLTLEVEIVQRRSPPADLAHLMLGGLGLRILEAPEDYQKLVYDDEEPEDDEEPDAPSTRREQPSTPRERGRFRALVANFKMARTRTLTVEAHDEAEAVKRVYQQLGPEWGVIEVTDQAKSGERRPERTVTRIPATFVSGATHGNGHIKNVSKEGLFLRSDILPAQGDLVSVVFFVPDGSKIEIFGTVLWSTAQIAVSEDVKPGFGMRIDQRNDAYLQFYEQLLTGYEPSG